MTIRMMLNENTVLAVLVIFQFIFFVVLFVYICFRSCWRNIVRGCVARDQCLMRRGWPKPDLFFLPIFGFLFRSRHEGVAYRYPHVSSVDEQRRALEIQQAWAQRDLYRRQMVQDLMLSRRLEDEGGIRMSLQDLVSSMSANDRESYVDNMLRTEVGTIFREKHQPDSVECLKKECSPRLNISCTIEFAAILWTSGWSPSQTRWCKRSTTHWCCH